MVRPTAKVAKGLVVMLLVHFGCASSRNAPGNEPSGQGFGGQGVQGEGGGSVAPTGSTTPNSLDGGDGTAKSTSTVIGRSYGIAALGTESAFTTADFDRVREHFLYFAHNSVGHNIIMGLDALAKSNSKYLLNQCTISDSAQLHSWCPLLGHGAGGLGDSGVGQNFDPLGKIRDFDSRIRAHGLGGTVDIALFKLCYVDTNAETDVPSLFAAYRSTMEGLEKSYPSTTFVWTTQPLWGKQDLDNVRHNEYGQLVREYSVATKRPLYDLADIESTRADGTRCTFEYGGTQYWQICPEWISTEAHLNEAASLRAAKVMLLMFADILRGRE